MELEDNQRSSRRIGGQNRCCASYFASVFLKQMVEGGSVLFFISSFFIHSFFIIQSL